MSIAYTFDECLGRLILIAGSFLVLVRPVCAQDNEGLNQKAAPFDNKEVLSVISNLRDNNRKIYNFSKGKTEKLRLDFGESVSFTTKYSNYLEDNPVLRVFSKIVKRLESMAGEVRDQNKIDRIITTEEGAMEKIFDKEQVGSVFSVGDIVFYSCVARFILAEEEPNSMMDGSLLEATSDDPTSDWKKLGISSDFKKVYTQEYRNFGHFFEETSR